MLEIGGNDKKGGRVQKVWKARKKVITCTQPWNFKSVRKNRR